MQYEPPAACIALAKKVPPPKIRVGDDYRAKLAEYIVALKKANARIEQIAACETAVRETYRVTK